MQSCIIILHSPTTSTCRMNWIRTFNWSPKQGPAGSNFWAGRFVGVLLQLGYNACIGLPLIGFFFSPQILFFFHFVFFFWVKATKIPDRLYCSRETQISATNHHKKQDKGWGHKEKPYFLLRYDEGWRKSISPLNFDTRPFLFLQWAYNHFQRPNQVLNSYYKLKLNILYAIKSLFSSGCLT